MQDDFLQQNFYFRQTPFNLGREELCQDFSNTFNFIISKIFEQSIDFFVRETRPVDCEKLCRFSVCSSSNIWKDCFF